MPVTTKDYEQSLSAAPLCEQLRIRDLLDNVAIQVDGSFVAGYELSASILITRATRGATVPRALWRPWFVPSRSGPCVSRCVTRFRRARVT